MSYLQISQCKRNLDFSPLHTWPREIPAFTWGEFLIAGFERSEGFTLDLSCGHPESFPDFLMAFGHCHPRLGVMELARVHKRWSSTLLPFEMNWPAFYLRYGIRGFDHPEIIFENLLRAPTEFQKWVEEKNPSLTDLTILEEVEMSAGLSALLLQISSLSKTMGCQALEWGGELLQREGRTEIHIPSEEVFFEGLRRMRFPETSSQDEGARHRIEQFPWPKRSSARWVRNGDEAFIEVKLLAKSLQELDAQAQTLKKIIHAHQDPH